MGTRKKSRAKVQWAVWLVIGIIIWLIGALSVSFYLSGRSGAVGKQECIASSVYLGILILVMAIGNFMRVRMLLAFEMLYGAGVLFRSVVGTLTALLIIDSPMTGRLQNFFDALVGPFAGLEYIAAQLTSHFITEIYWLGLGLSATILIFLACAAFMAVGSRIARERMQWRHRRDQRTEMETPQPRKPRSMAELRK